VSYNATFLDMNLYISETIFIIVSALHGLSTRLSNVIKSFKMAKNKKEFFRKAENKMIKFQGLQTISCTPSSLLGLGAFGVALKNNHISCN
jgi:hypothetical protein